MLNVIVLWNTLYIDAALDQLRAQGFDVRDEDIARLSPLVHGHINVLGRYSFAVPEVVAPSSGHYGTRMTVLKPVCRVEGWRGCGSIEE